MSCPKCYGKIDKNTQTCTYCGFRMSETNDATNKKAKKALKTIYKDDVLFVTKLPSDVSKKKLLLFAVFFGLFGVHDFYVGKFWHGLFKSVCSGVTLLLTIINGLLSNIIDNLLTNIFKFASVFSGLVLLLVIYDVVNIILSKYKVPVYKEEFSKKQ